MKKAGLYARVSSTRQRNEGWSIPAQIKFLHEYAQKNNIEIVKEFVETDYAKTSSGAPMGSRIFDLEEIFGKNKKNRLA